MPTIWQGILGLDDVDSLGELKEIVCGGSAVPESLIRAFDERFGVPIIQAWGMTETSPLASIAPRAARGRRRTEDERYKVRAHAGPRRRRSSSSASTRRRAASCRCTGPWIARDYYDDDDLAREVHRRRRG